MSRYYRALDRSRKFVPLAVKLLGVDVRRGARPSAIVGVTGIGASSINPLHQIANALSDSLDPVKTPGRVRTMADMTPEELAALVPPRTSKRSRR